MRVFVGCVHLAKDHSVFLTNKAEFVVASRVQMGMGQNLTTRGPQVLVLGSVYQGKPFCVPIFDPQPNVCPGP